MNKSIPHSRPSLGEAEAEAAARVVRSGLLAQGREVELFECEMADYVGRNYAVAVSSGTAALHLGLMALGMGQGATVAMPSYVCTALLHATWAAGARPLLCDIDGTTGNIDAAALAKLDAPDALIVPHMFGCPADIDAVESLGIPFIEDCAMALGGHCGDRPVGSRGALSICSFYATKVLAAGEGGMVLTDDANLAERVRQLRAYDGLHARTPRFNAKMTDVHAAIGRVQLSRLDEFVARRRWLADFYRESLADLRDITSPLVCEGHIYYRYIVKTPRKAEVFMRRLEDAGIVARRPVYAPLHRELALADGDFPRAVEAHESDLSLPLYPSLSDGEARRVVAAVCALEARR